MVCGSIDPGCVHKYLLLQATISVAPPNTRDQNGLLPHQFHSRIPHLREQNQLLGVSILEDVGGTVKEVVETVVDRLRSTATDKDKTRRS